MTDDAPSAALAARLLAAAPDGVLALDREGRYLAWNAAMERITGVPARDVLGRVAWEAFPFLAGLGMPALVEAALAGREVVSPDWEFSLPDTGARGWTETRFAPLLGDGGEVEGVVAIVRDVTGRHRAAAEREGRAAAILDGMGDGFSAFDRDFRYLYVNREVERLAGLAREELLGRVLWELFPESLGTEGERELRRVMRDRVRASFVEYVPRVERWVEVRAFPTPGGIAVYTRDVTEARRTEAALRESEARFRALADTAPVMIWMSDTRNLGTYFNRPWLQFTGRAMEEELGTGWAARVHPDDLERAVAYCASRFEAREEFRMEFRLRRADGEYRWVLDHGIPRYGGDGAFLGYIGSCVDITEIKHAEGALRASEERYRSLAEASSQMVWSADARGMVEDMPGWRALTGQTLEEVRGAGWADALHPDDRPRALEAWRRARDARAPYEAEYRLRLKDGSYRWMAARGVPVLHPDGGVREWVGLLNDVHDRRTAEAAVREREERFRLATRATRDVVWDWDLATDTVRWNEALAEVLGHPEGGGHESAEWWYDQIHPDDRDRVVEGIHEAIHRRHEVWRDEYRFRRGDGAYATVLDRGYVLLGADGRALRMIGAMQDVTGLRHAEAARESERERLRRVLVQIPVAVTVHEGPTHVFVAMSDQARRMMGRPGGFLGLPAREALPELAAQGFAEPLDHVYATGRPVSATGAVALWDADGDGVPEEHVVDYVYQPLTDASGAVYGVVSLVMEVTERHRAAQEVAEARREAERRAAEAALLAERLRDQADELQTEVEESTLLAEELRAANEELLAASRRAEQARRRIEILAEASSRLAASLDFRETVQTVAQLAVPALADWCFVEVKEEDGSIRLLAAGHQDPARVAFAFDVMARYPIDPQADYGTARVMRTGEPELMLDIAPELFDAVPDPELRRIYHEVAFRSSISVPLTVAGRTFGVLSLVYSEESGRRYTEADLPLARELAHRAATAMENARLYGEALAANRAKAGFLATMSHELRTPLNAMIGYVDLLLLGIPEAIPPRAQSQVERIRLASRHLLSIIEEILTFSRIEAGRETVEAEEVDLSALAGEVSAIIEPLAAEKGLAFRTPERVDPPTVRADPRKLRQVLVNLLGNAVKFTREGSVSFEVERGRGAVLLHVRDTGIGVEPADHELIFEPFRQVDAATTRTAGGTGLGLSVSRQLARLMGGDVTVTSAPGEGSTFTVSLPDCSSPDSSDSEAG